MGFPISLGWNSLFPSLRRSLLASLRLECPAQLTPRPSCSQPGCGGVRGVWARGPPPGQPAPRAAAASLDGANGCVIPSSRSTGAAPGHGGRWGGIPVGLGTAATPVPRVLHLPWAHGVLSHCSHPRTASSETNPHRSKRSLGRSVQKLLSHD